METTRQTQAKKELDRQAIPHGKQTLKQLMKQNTGVAVYLKGNGNCLLLDDGEECVCPQSISYSLNCRWFRAAVLPLDESLCAALLHRRERKRCVLCGGWYIPKSNRAKYCPECAKEEERHKTCERVRRHRAAM